MLRTSVVVGVLIALWASPARDAKAQGEPSTGSSLSRQTGRYGQTRISSPQEARNDYAPILAMLVPGYIYRLDGGASVNDGEHGTIWSIPIWIREPDWRHGAALSFAQYPRTNRQTGRLVYRLRAFSAPSEGAILHMLLGVGSFWDRDDGLGPRAELSWLLGGFGRGGGLLSFGYEYVVTDRINVIDISVTFFVPYVIR